MYIWSTKIPIYFNPWMRLDTDPEIHSDPVYNTQECISVSVYIYGKIYSRRLIDPDMEVVLYC